MSTLIALCRYIYPNRLNAGGRYFLKRPGEQRSSTVAQKIGITHRKHPKENERIGFSERIMIRGKVNVKVARMKV
jgi:hypothetical protein